MTTKILLAPFFVGALFIAYPQELVADKTDKQYQHAAQIFRQGDLEAAEREFEEILRAKPQYANARTLLGATHFLLGLKAEENGDRTRAVSELREAVRLEPDEAYWHSELAKVLDEQGDADGAAKECTEAAKLSPDDADLASGCGFKKSEVPEKKSERSQENEGEADAKVSEVRGEISPPRPAYKPAPLYSEKARSVGYDGTTTLWVVVNAQGSVEGARVVRPAGLGLDQKALETVRTWRFTPATRDGIPVAVRVSIEVSFRIK